MKHDTQPATTSEWRADGDACAARGELQAALQCFEAARSLDPTDVMVLERLAATLAALNRFPEAVVRYQEGIGLDPRNTDLRHGLGWSLEQMHRLEQAVEAYCQPVPLNPHPPPPSTTHANR